MTLITFSQQQTIKPISANNEDRFEQIMLETENTELQDLLGLELYNDVVLNPTTTENARLIAGLSWEYGNATIKMHGLKYVLAYYFYANYIYESDLQDTFSGVKIHRFDESNDADKSRKDKQAKRARENSGKYWTEVKLYLDNNSSDYPLWNCSATRKTYKPKISRLSRPIMNTDFSTFNIDRITSTPQPDEAVTPLENFGVITLSAGDDQEILFSSGTGTTNLGTTNYKLIVTAYDSGGVQVFPTIVKAEDGFTVDLVVGATINWEATQL